MKAWREQLFLGWILLRGLPLMARATIEVPRLKREAARDRERLAQRFPVLAGHAARRRDLLGTLSAPKSAYTRSVSSAWVAITDGLGAWLLDLCRQLQPRSILDLGSGFSTYVFALYARERPGVVLTSVEEDPFWQKRTTRFLADHHLEGFVRWENRAGELPARGADLLFLDLGDFDRRPCLVRQALPALRDGAIAVCDDAHLPGYGAFLRQLAAREGLECLSLRDFTLHRLRYAVLLHDPAARGRRAAALPPLAAHD